MIAQIWILLDYGDVMVHVFDEENRGFLQLRKTMERCSICGC